MREMTYLTLSFVLMCTLASELQSMVISRWNACVPDQTVFRIVYGVSLLRCAKDCQRIGACDTMSYNRLFGECRFSILEAVSDPASGVTECHVNVLIRRDDISSRISDEHEAEPVLDMEELPHCAFEYNIDESSVAVTCPNEDKLSIYTKTPSGLITNHMTVFRAISGNRMDTYYSWMGRDEVTLLKSCTSLRTCTKHFRHHVVRWWNRLAIKKIKVSMKKNSAEVAFIVFQGEGRDIENWFAKDGVIESSWPSLDLQSEFIYFSLLGDDPGRRFYISLYYDGCDGDRLVMFSTTTNQFGCSWDSIQTAPQITYSDQSGASFGDDLKHADILEVELHF